MMRQPQFRSGARLAFPVVAALGLLANSGCTNLNHWDGPRYRDDPVVSEVSRSHIQGADPQPATAGANAIERFN
jgi:hypothetical protein